MRYTVTVAITPLPSEEEDEEASLEDQFPELNPAYIPSPSHQNISHVFDHFNHRYNDSS